VVGSRRVIDPRAGERSKPLIGGGASAMCRVDPKSSPREQGHGLYVSGPSEAEVGWACRSKPQCRGLTQSHDSFFFVPGARAPASEALMEEAPTVVVGPALGDSRTYGFPPRKPPLESVPSFGVATEGEAFYMRRMIGGCAAGGQVWGYHCGMKRARRPTKRERKAENGRGHVGQPPSAEFIALLAEGTSTPPKFKRGRATAVAFSASTTAVRVVNRMCCRRGRSVSSPSTIARTGVKMAAAWQ